MKLEEMKYSEMRAYAFNQIIKQYCNFPKFLPLPCHLEHGWTALMEPLKSDLLKAKNKKLMLVYNKRRAESWKVKSNIPVEIMGAPFIHFRRINNFKQHKDAHGTIAFPSHSTNSVESQFDINKYCKQLNKLPKEFKPITVCLHSIDINSDKTKIYKKWGFKTTSAGRIGNDLGFVKNFYKILGSHKYTTSNDIGSYTFYAIEMNIPFFLLGDQPLILNIDKKDPNIPESHKITDYEYGIKATKLFSTGPIKQISNEQKQFVINEVGINNCLSPEELNKLFWKIFHKEHYYIKAVPLYLLAYFVRKIIR